ncbi:histidine kinase [Prevotella sp. LCP21S3_D2]|uniref:histidine kinase n=1 Tax=Prevotella sp. LCP21S3_D2 TaxID=3438800 RepID=UPI003F9DC087
MTELKKYTWLWLMGCMMLLAACSSEKKEDDSWYRPIDEFVTQHQQMMQSQPDSMILQIRNLKCGGKPELVEQWKRLIVAKCCYLKGADPECQALIDSVNSYCRQNPDLETTFKIQSYADNLQGVLLQAVGKREPARTYYIRAYHELMKLDNHNDAIDICINIADASRQLGKLADASSWYRRANFLADSLDLHEAQNSILTGLGQVYNDLRNYQLAHFYFRKAERQYPPKNPKDAHFFYNSWGNVYSSQEKPAEALKCFLKAQKAARQMGQPFMTAVVDANLGQTYLELNRLDSAQKYLANTTKFFFVQPNMQNDLQFYIDGLNAALALKLNRLDKASAILGKPYDLSKMSPNYLYLYHKGWADLYERKGQFAKALQYQKLMKQYDDSLRNATMVSNVQENELRFKQDTAIVRRDLILQSTQAEAKSSRLILLLVIGLLVVGVLALVVFYRYKSLRHKHQHREEMNRMMALKMENVRNRFSPHFVFNVLNIFISNLPKGVNVKPLRLLIQVLRANLLTCDQVAVSLEDELQMVMSYSSLRHETNPLLPMPRFDIAKEVDMSLMLPSMIIQIPVENALKHAFVGMEESGEKPLLDVKIWVEDGMLRIDVIDNGCGGVGAVAGMGTRKTNAAASTGTGLRILNSTIEMLNAGNARKLYFKMQSRAGAADGGSDRQKGTCVSIGVPCEYDYSVCQ